MCTKKRLFFKQDKGRFFYIYQNAIFCSHADDGVGILPFNDNHLMKHVM